MQDRVMTHLREAREGRRAHPNGGGRAELSESPIDTTCALRDSRRVAGPKGSNAWIWILIAGIAVPVLVVLGLVCGGGAMGFLTYQRARSDMVQEMERARREEAERRRAEEEERAAMEEEARRAAEAAEGL